jgi:hypothetical protein
MKDGERGRNRTFNLLIKSQLLCQLSYAPIANCKVGTNFDYTIGFFALACAHAGLSSPAAQTRLETQLRDYAEAASWLCSATAGCAPDTGLRAGRTSA